MIDKFVYTPTLIQRSALFDFGNIYEDEPIGQEYTKKTLLYEIPKQLIDQEIIFSFVKKDAGNLKENDTKIKLEYKDLTKEKETNINKIKDMIFFDMVNKFNLQITHMNVSKKYKLSYNYCIDDTCFKSYEYLKPGFYNEDKVLLKIVGTLEKDHTNIVGIYDLYDFIYNFGTLKYEVNGKTYTQRFLNEIVSKRYKAKNTYYIEVNKEVIKADSISILFHVRNENFEYIIK